MTGLRFVQLNNGWGAEPNVPNPVVSVVDKQVCLSFRAKIGSDDRAALTFTDCTAWRLGNTNDEGWYLGQCRYSGIAPVWGEFYEIIGDDALREQPDDWSRLRPSDPLNRHFLFYLRDETFEVFAQDWIFCPSVRRI